MTPDQLIVFGILAAALVLFVTEALSAEVVAVVVVLALVGSGVLAAEEAFRGFGSQPIIFLAGLFVLSGGLVKTGVVETVALFLQASVRGRPGRLAAACVATVAGVSAFVSNTVTVSLFVPVVNRLSRRGGMAPGQVLMPLAHASMLGGVCTVVGTSTNVVVSGELPDFGQAPYGLLETAWVGLPALAVGLVYLLVVAPRLLTRPASDETDRYAMRRYLAEVIVDPDSSWAGRTLRAVRPRDAGVEVLGVVRDGGEVRVVDPGVPFREGDAVVVKATTDDLLALKTQARLRTVADEKLLDDAAADLVLVEAMVSPGSTLAGHTLKEARFRQRFGAAALAVYRHGEALHAKVGRVRLHVGDILLIQGTPNTLDTLSTSHDLLVLEKVAHPRARRRDRLVALSIFAAFLVVGTLTGSFAVAALGGAALMVATGCITAEEAYEFTAWRVLVVVGGMIAMATAMRETDAAALLAHQVVVLVGGGGGRLLLAAFFVLTVALTQAMSNQAAALVVLPVAVAAAAEAGVGARGLAVTVTVAASCAFMTPLEPASILVHGPGRYRFRDFLIVGTPLTLIVLALTIIIVPVVWPG